MQTQMQTDRQSDKNTKKVQWSAHERRSGQQINKFKILPKKAMKDKGLKHLNDNKYAYLTPM